MSFLKLLVTTIFLSFLLITVASLSPTFAHDYQRGAGVTCRADHNPDVIGGVDYCIHTASSGTGTTNPALGTVTFPAGFSLDASKILNNLVGVFIAIGGLVFFFMLLFGGIRFMTAGGDPKNAESARKTITNAVIGLIIVVSAFLITTVLGELLGIDFLKPNIPGL